MSELRSFRKYADAGHAKEIAELLTKNGIKCHLIEVSSSLDSSFGGGEQQTEYEIKLDQKDFEQANSILYNEASKSIEQVSPNHYLFEFTNQELYEVLMKSEEWNEFDYNLAIKILNERGEHVSDDLIRSLKKQRLDDLAKPEESQTAWIYVGYLFALLGGFLGLFIGWYIWRSKKTLPNGQKVYNYNNKDRSHGYLIFIIGVILFPIALVLRIMSEF